MWKNFIDKAFNFMVSFGNYSFLTFRTLDRMQWKPIGRHIDAHCAANVIAFEHQYQGDDKCAGAAHSRDKNRAEFEKKLKKAKYVYYEWLAQIPVYRMTLEEVKKCKEAIKNKESKLWLTN